MRRLVRQILGIETDSFQFCFWWTGVASDTRARGAGLVAARQALLLQQCLMPGVLPQKGRCAGPKRSNCALRMDLENGLLILQDAR